MTGNPQSVTRAVVIGASAGGVDALLKIVPELPADYSLAVIIVVHLPPNRESALVKLLESRCLLPVKEAEDKEPILPGMVYLAPPNYHLLVEPEFFFALSNEEQVHYSRPSIDVLFESAADAFGDELAGVILSGANADGAAGLRAVAEAGGIAFVQDPDSAEAEAMPRAALLAWPAAGVLTPAGIAVALKTPSLRILS